MTLGDSRIGPWKTNEKLEIWEIKSLNSSKAEGTGEWVQALGGELVNHGYVSKLFWAQQENEASLDAHWWARKATSLISWGEGKQGL